MTLRKADHKIKVADFGIHFLLLQFINGYMYTGVHLSTLNICYLKHTNNITNYFYFIFTQCNRKLLISFFKMYLNFPLSSEMFTLLVQSPKMKTH